MNVSELIANLSAQTGCRFASILYTAKASGEVARHTVNLGFSYHNSVENSLAELREMMPQLSGIEFDAAKELETSFAKTLAAHAVGEQNSDYTKKGQYHEICKGLNVNLLDGSFQLFGLTVSKDVVTPGTHRVVKSAPLTVAKDKLRKSLPVGKFREFALDAGTVQSVRANGETLIFD
jgi:hypothetical protein